MSNEKIDTHLLAEAEFMFYGGRGTLTASEYVEGLRQLCEFKKRIRERLCHDSAHPRPGVYR